MGIQSFTGTVVHGGNLLVNGERVTGIMIATDGVTAMKVHRAGMFEKSVVIIADRRKEIVPTTYDRRRRK
jgi:hypothetical protein